MWPTAFAAFGLMLIFEGVMPLTVPRRWKDAFRRLLEFSDGQLRFFGLASIIVGLVVLFVSRLL